MIIDEIGKNDRRVEMLFFPERIVVRVYHQNPNRDPNDISTYYSDPEDRVYLPAVALAEEKTDEQAGEKKAEGTGARD